MKANEKLYVAYGSNLNVAQMRHRCPTAKLYGTGEIKDYELQFKGYPDCAYATIAPKEGASVPVAVWTIGSMDDGMQLHETARDRGNGGAEVTGRVGLCGGKGLGGTGTRRPPASRNVTAVCARVRVSMPRGIGVSMPHEENERDFLLFGRCEGDTMGDGGMKQE